CPLLLSPGHARRRTRSRRIQERRSHRQAAQKRSREAATDQGRSYRIRRICFIGPRRALQTGAPFVCTADRLEVAALMNALKTAVLLGLLSAILLVGGQAIAGRQGLYMGLTLAVVMNFASYFFSDK